MLTLIEDSLKEVGWERVSKNEHMGVGFSHIFCLQDSLLAGGADWHFLVHELNILDDAEAINWQARFDQIKEKSRPTIITPGKPFILCLLASHVSPSSIKTLKSDSFENDSRAVGIFLVINRQEKVIHGLVPDRPWNARKHIKKIKQILTRALEK